MSADTQTPQARPDGSSEQHAINSSTAEDGSTPDSTKPSAQPSAPTQVDGGNGATTKQPQLADYTEVKESQIKGSDTGKGPIAARASGLKDKITDKKEKFSDKKDQIKSKKPPGGFDDAPLPDAPQGYTVKFTFHKASNLPAADLHTHSSDPFLHATLIGPIPKRHKEDPPLIHRTQTVRRSTEPEWNEEWIVANVPQMGFTLKCRLYDEDWPDHDDRLGNVTIKVPHLDENWEGIGGPEGQVFEVKKRSGSKRAYFFKALTSSLSKDTSMTPRLHISIQVIGRSDPPYGQMYTLGPTFWVKHNSPMIGRLAGIKVNKDERRDVTTSTHADDEQTKKYDFQANELQLQGPVPAKLYHRYVEFRPIIGMMFSDHGLRGRILNKALHKQHKRIYNYDSGTEYGQFKACSEEASLQLLKMAHFDEGGRIFTYVITLDGLMRFTETGQESGIDLLSKHTMHSDVATYIACSGEFFIRRLAHPDSSEDPNPNEATHPDAELPGGPPTEPPPRDPRHYQLIIDNDSGTYRPDKSVLPDLKEFLERNFPGLGVIVMHCEDKELDKLKKAQKEVKKKEGQGVKMVLNRSPTSSTTSFSSDDESRLGDLQQHAAQDDGGQQPLKSKKEQVFDVIQDPMQLKTYLNNGLKK
ncbi:hypothetical protein QBC46DRAFT_384059 [Diplogelasinospora grovesii]|uniref:C2 domain-containing protein n=1 Tax=Diplogelasinospora grovesii TaxID=303347 RepID=A0AAN6N834_9PEZI|nr:hypothetical protein QBC46DRAFT_384059 [Diplogelasinospora grovesii]